MGQRTAPPLSRMEHEAGRALQVAARARAGAGWAGGSGGSHPAAPDRVLGALAPNRGNFPARARPDFLQRVVYCPLGLCSEFVESFALC